MPPFEMMNASENGWRWLYTFCPGAPEFPPQGICCMWVTYLKGHYYQRLPRMMTYFPCTEVRECERMTVASRKPQLLMHIYQGRGTRE